MFLIFFKVLPTAKNLIGKGSYRTETAHKINFVHLKICPESYGSEQKFLRSYDACRFFGISLQPLYVFDILYIEKSVPFLCKKRSFLGFISGWDPN